LPELTTQLRFTFANGLPVWQLGADRATAGKPISGQICIYTARPDVGRARCDWAALARICAHRRLPDQSDGLLQTLQKIAVPLAVLVDSSEV